VSTFRVATTYLTHKIYQLCADTKYGSELDSLSLDPKT